LELKEIDSPATHVTILTDTLNKQNEAPASLI